jgi:hypothetical protein
MGALYWEKTENSYSLISHGEKLITLNYHPVNKNIFWIGEDAYEVVRSGFWNMRYIITKDNQQWAQLRHKFWGSKGDITFADGSNYSSDYLYKNILTLRFLDGGEEILRYHVGEEALKKTAILTPGIALIDGERLLQLAALGMIIFLGIFNEFNESGDGDVIALA